MRLLAIIAIAVAVDVALGQGNVYGGAANGGSGGNVVTDGSGNAYGGPGASGGQSVTVAYNGSFNTVTVERLACGSGAATGTLLSLVGLACFPRGPRTVNLKVMKGGGQCTGRNASVC